MSINSLAVFHFEAHDIRFVDGKPVANDVAKALGYADPKSAIRDLVFAENKGVGKMPTIRYGENKPRIQEITFLEEAGIYQLIFSSKLKSAQKFQQWVFSEILPSIRETGSYSVQPKTPQTYLEALEELVAKEKENIALRSQNTELVLKIEENAPKVALADSIAFSESCIDFNAFAKIIGTGRTRLFQKMREAGVIMKTSNLPYQRWVDLGMFEISEEVCNGKIIPFALVTGKGQVWLKQRLDHYQSIEKKAIQGIVHGVLATL